MGENRIRKIDIAGVLYTEAEIVAADDTITKTLSEPITLMEALQPSCASLKVRYFSPLVFFKLLVIKLAYQTLTFSNV